MVKRSLSLGVSAAMMLGFGGCGQPKETLPSAFRTGTAVDVKYNPPQVLEEVRATVSTLLGEKFSGDVHVVHVPRSFLDTVRFELQGSLYVGSMVGYPVPNAFLSYVDPRQDLVFAEAMPTTPPFRVVLISEERPYQYAGDYYLSRVVSDQIYEYAVGIDLDRASQLGINAAGLVLDVSESVHPILLLRKQSYGAVDPMTSDPQVDPKK